MRKTISIIIPVFNEEKNIPFLDTALIDVFEYLDYDYEMIFVNDGSLDNSQAAIELLAAKNEKIKYIELSRNFGKELAISAGLDNASGDAVVVIDADMQHPPALMVLLIQKWENGAEIVIGRRTKNKGEGFVKKVGSYIYYQIMNRISDTHIESGATDFRLIDRKVVDEFKRFTEHERITRGLIDWLGFKREYVEFKADKRLNGKASYSNAKLIKLAVSSFVAHSIFPLKFAGYLGITVIFLSGLLGFSVLIEKYVFDDGWNWNVSGTAQLAILMIFFIGIVLACLGLVALYIGNIHNEVSNRPLYVVRSKGNMQKII